MEKLRSISKRPHPNIEEIFYGGKEVKMALYSIGNKNNVSHGISASKDHCKLFLHHFNKVDTNMYKLEGKGKHARHIKIFKMEDLDEKAILATLTEVTNITSKNL